MGNSETSIDTPPINSVDCVYMESGNGETRMARLYGEDLELVLWKIRKEQVTRKRTVSIAEIIHEQLAQLRLDKRAEQRERGNNVQK